MPNISNVRIYNLEESIRTAKYSKSVDLESLNTELTPGIMACAKSPIGSGHDNFLNGITVYFDLTFSNKAWVEAERYHFFDFVMSQSTMHKATSFNLQEQCNRYVDQRVIDILKSKVNEYNRLKELEKTEGSSKERKLILDELYLQILYNIPSGFELTAGMVTNYRQLKTMYHQRRNHKLPDWQYFCDWIETLPHSEFITGD